MESWAPATEAEAAMRDVLRAGDQEHYFRILARLDLLLPVSADSAGRRSPGWGTWSSDGRTHVLAFTSIQAMRGCLAEHAGNYRLAQFRELAEQWPNPEWWLAINPGLPIEGYLPAWFVAQISRGDVRLPGRAMGSRARMEHANTLRARAVAQVPRRVPPAPPVPAGGGRMPPGRRPPGAGVVLSGEIVESTPVDEPVSPAAPTPVQPAARTVMPGIPGATAGGRAVRQPGVVPPGRERSAEPFPSSPAPAPGAVPAAPAPAAAAAMAMPAAPTPPVTRPGRGDSNGRGDGVIPGRPDRHGGFDRPDARDRTAPVHDRPGLFEQSAQGERPDSHERSGPFERSGRADRPAESERFGPGDRPGRDDRVAPGDRFGPGERSGHDERFGPVERPGHDERFGPVERPGHDERFGPGERPTRGDRFGPVERPTRGDRFGPAERPARADRSGPGEGPVQGGDRVQTDRPDHAGPFGPGERPAQGDRVGPGGERRESAQPAAFQRPETFERPSHGRRPGEPGLAGAFQRRGPGGADRDRPGRQVPPPAGPFGPPDAPQSPPVERLEPGERPGFADRPERGDRPGFADRPERGDRPGSVDRPAAFADEVRPTSSQPAPDAAYPPAQADRPRGIDDTPPAWPDRPRAIDDTPPWPAGRVPTTPTVPTPGYPAPDRAGPPSAVPGYGPEPVQPAASPGYGAEPVQPAASPGYGAEPMRPAAAPPGYGPPDVARPAAAAYAPPDSPRPADTPVPGFMTPDVARPAAAAPGFGPPPDFASPGSGSPEFAPPAAAASGGFGSPEFAPPAAAASGGFGSPDFAPPAAAYTPQGPVSPSPAGSASGYAPPEAAPEAPAVPSREPTGYAPSDPVTPAGSTGYAAGYAEADPTPGYPGWESAPADVGGYAESGDHHVEEVPAPFVATGSGDSETYLGLGLGARLAALQAQSGGFSVIPVDAPDDRSGERPATRGMWDPKVPAAPAEPDDEPTPYQDTPQPGDEPVTASSEFDSGSDVRTPPREPESEQFDYSAFPPANDTERELLEAHRSGSSNSVLSTLLLAKVLIPGYSLDPGSWPIEDIAGGRYLVAFTSAERLAARSEAARPEPPAMRFTSVIARWPGEDIGFALNPGTPMGKLLGGSEVRGLARSAAEFGLIDDADESESTQLVTPPQPAARPAHTSPPVGQPQLMQRTVAAAQVAVYLERGYDRVCGFVHRASELSHLSKPIELYRALGLLYPDSPFKADDAEVYVLRWPAHLLGLYRIPFGGQSEEALQAMQGWMIERAPFRGNGFAPSESSDVVAEFKIDSTRLPHGAQLWRLNSEGIETLVALFDADGTRWRKIGNSDA